MAQDREHGPTVTQDIGPWRVQMSWPVGADQGGPRSVTITPGPDATEAEIATGVSSVILRQVDFRAAAGEWRAQRVLTQLDMLPAWKDHQAKQLRELLAKGITVDYLALLADTYVELVRQGHPSVTAKLCEMTGKRPPTIRTHLGQARSRDLLTTPGRGRVGGELTPVAKKILREHAEEPHPEG